jgi:hypothetical protein
MDSVTHRRRVDGCVKDLERVNGVFDTEHRIQLAVQDVEKVLHAHDVVRSTLAMIFHCDVAPRPLVVGE